MKRESKGRGREKGINEEREKGINEEREKGINEEREKEQWAMGNKQ